jgi:hypothetical protein
MSGSHEDGRERQKVSACCPWLIASATQVLRWGDCPRNKVFQTIVLGHPVQEPSSPPHVQLAKSRIPEITSGARDSTNMRKNNFSDT